MGPATLNPIFLIIISVAITAIALVYSIIHRDQSKLTRRWVFLLSLPGLIMVAGFYSFAARMHSALGGWPDSNGTEELPKNLLLHDGIQSWMFFVTFLVALLIPLVLALFSLVPRLRTRLIYPAFFGSACWLCLFATQLAPKGFLYWFWD